MISRQLSNISVNHGRFYTALGLAFVRQTACVVSCENGHRVDAAHITVQFIRQSAARCAVGFTPFSHERKIQMNRVSVHFVYLYLHIERRFLDEPQPHIGGTTRRC